MQKTEPKKNWTMTSSAFHGLLKWLDEGEDSGGQKYLEMQQRLVGYFDRKNCRLPNELADETLNRVARRLAELTAIETETPAKYCYITARFVFLESLRAIEKKNVPIDDILLKPPENQITAAEIDETNEIREKRLNCLEECVGKLEPVSRELIVNYYFGTERIKIENRRSLAQKLDISINALSIRACRIRDKLESCVGKCVAEN